MTERYVSTADRHGMSRASRYHEDPECGTLSSSNIKTVSDNEIQWHDLEPCDNCASEEWTETEFDNKFPDKVTDLIDNINDKFDEAPQPPEEFKDYKKV